MPLEDLADELANLAQMVRLAQERGALEILDDVVERLRAHSRRLAEERRKKR